MAVNLLLSYAFHAKTDLAAVRRDLVCGRLMIDSGAFTAYSIGKPISIDEYAEYLERWRGSWDHAITLDVIGDHEATMRNTRILHNRGLPVMPVFTRGGKMPDFDAMIRDAGFVCVGGLVGLPKAAQTKRVGVLQQRARELGGGIHALGIGSVEVLRKTRPFSADASTLSSAFRFGCVVYFNGARIVAVPLSDRKTLTKDREIIRAHGVDLGPLVASRRMPTKADRADLMRSMGVAYAVVDEHLKATHPVPAPGGGDDPGTHLYNSVSSGDTFGASSLDPVLHGPAGAVPQLWGRYQRGHKCRTAVAG